MLSQRRWRRWRLQCSHSAGHAPRTTSAAARSNQCFLELGGRYRHCDVYWAMRQKLKGKKLACHRAYWSLLGDEAILADPNLSPAGRA